MDGSAMSVRMFCGHVLSYDPVNAISEVFSIFISQVIESVIGHGSRLISMGRSVITLCYVIVASSAIWKVTAFSH